MRCYQPNRILVVVREQLNIENITPPISTILTENVVNVSHIIYKFIVNWKLWIATCCYYYALI